MFVHVIHSKLVRGGVKMESAETVTHVTKTFDYRPNLLLGCLDKHLSYSDTSINTVRAVQK